MSYLVQMPKRSLYLLRGFGVASLGAAALMYLTRRDKAVSPAQRAMIESELLSDLPVAKQAPESRVAFIKKVYSVVALQLGGVALSTAVAFRSPAFRRICTGPGWILGMIGSFGTMFALSTNKVRSNEALKKKVLGAFTLSEMLWFPIVCLPFPKEIVLTALLNTGAITAGITAYAHKSKHDFTPYRGLVAGLVFGFMVALVSGLFFPRLIKQQLLSYAGAAIFSVALILDTQTILGKGKIAYKQSDYDRAALSLFLDVLNLFIRVLEIVAMNQKK